MKDWFFLLLLALMGNIANAAVENKVIVSTHPLALITADLVPKAITVESIGGRNHSLHHQGFKPSQIKRVSEAGLVLWLGAKTDASFVKVIAKAQPLAIRNLLALVSLQAPLLSSPSLSNNNDHPAVDVHVWLNPHNALILATEISVQLAAIWPEHQAEIEENLRQFTGKMDAISSEIPIKSESRDFLALHNAYGHLAKFYSLSAIGAIVDGDGEKPGAQHLWQLEKQLKGRTGVCVLVQPQFSQRYLSSINRVVAVVTAEIDPAASKYAVAKGEFVRYSKEIAGKLTNCMNLQH
jgi:zinc transport system substrate-binding protein